MAKTAEESTDFKTVVRTALTYQSGWIHILYALGRTAKKYHIPLVNFLAVKILYMYYGFQISARASIGEGTFFIHPLGILIGGTTKIGKNVRFYGQNVLGSARDKGDYPTIEDRVTLGVGSKILGAITIGADSIIGANVVVTKDVKPNSVLRIQEHRTTVYDKPPKDR